MASGSILIDLLMRTGAFETDTKKAERALKKLQKEAIDVGKAMGATLAAGAITAAYAFDKLVKGAADFKDLEEMAGASAEDLASLAVAAGTAGVEMETLAANSIRLTKNLTGVDDESKAAGAGIKALGLDLAAFKALDPVAQVDALTKAFANFKDGPQKAAVATALWGKSGAEMLKVMKALEEQGGRTKILTQTQIEQADAYADAQGKAAAELRLYAQAAATQGAPAFLALTNAAADFIKQLMGVDLASGQLAQSTAIKDFADNAVRAIAFVVDAGDGAIRVFKGIGLSIGGLLAAADAAVTGNLSQARRIIGELGADLDALANKKFFSDTLAARMGQSGPSPAGPDTRPQLQFNGATSGARGGRAGRNPSMSMEQVWRAQQQAEEDFLQESAEAWDIYNKGVMKQSAERADAEKKQWEQVFDFIDAEQERAIEEGKAFLDAQVKQADSFSKRFAENTQDLLGQGLYDAMTGNFKNIGDAFQQMILRMVAEAAAADLARTLFGGMVKGGQGGGVLGSIMSFFGGFFADGGDPPVGKASIVGERGPELFVPRTAGTIMPADKTASLMRQPGRSSRSVVINLGGYHDRKTPGQLAAAYGQAVEIERMRGTAAGSR